MTRLRELWPPEIFNHIRWFQQDLELMRKSAKREFSQFTSRLFGASTEWPRCSVDIEDREYREVCPTMDCTSGVVDRFAAGGAFRHFN